MEYRYHLGYITDCLGCLGDEILPSFVGILIN